jgi:triacylglycerol lipase
MLNETPFSPSLRFFTTLLLSILDFPAYANLTSTYLNTVFNPTTNDPRVKYFSVADRVPWCAFDVHFGRPRWFWTDGGEKAGGG